REVDAGEDPGPRGTVYECRFVEVRGDAVDVPFEQPRVIGKLCGKTRDDQPRETVEQTEVQEQHVDGDGAEERREDLQYQHRRQRERSTAKAQPGEDVSAERRYDDAEDHVARRDDERIQIPPWKIGCGE